MSTKTLFRWEQDPRGGDHGTLTLWPDTARELRMKVQNFELANTLGMAINGAIKDAFLDGRKSMQAEVARLVA